MQPLPSSVLPNGVRGRILPGINGLDVHVLEAGHEAPGRTTGWDASYDGDLASFRVLNLLRDVMGVTRALGHRSVEAVVGHDFGVTPAAYGALLRPDFFKRLVLMSGPFAGPPPLVSAPRPAGPD